MNNWVPDSLGTEVLHELEICNPGVSADILRTAFKADGTIFYYDYKLKQEQLTDISPLAKLRLKGISIIECDVTDISAIAGCTDLEDLDIRGSKVEKLPSFNEWHNLKRISLSFTRISDVSSLSQCRSLTYINLYGTCVSDISCLASLPHIENIELRKTNVTDLSAFAGCEKILQVERSKLPKQKKTNSSNEKIHQIQNKMKELKIIANKPATPEDIADFEKSTGIRLPKEYTTFYTKIGNGLAKGINVSGFLYRILPLKEVEYYPEYITQKFKLKDEWIWEDDENATDKKIEDATKCGQLFLTDCGDGACFSLVVDGPCKGEVWSLTDVGMSPYNHGTDFLTWFLDLLDGKAYV